MMMLMMMMMMMIIDYDPMPLFFISNRFIVPPLSEEYKYTIIIHLRILRHGKQMERGFPSAFYTVPYTVAHEMGQPISRSSAFSIVMARSCMNNGG